MVLTYHRQKFDRMERGEHHKAMRKFIRDEELDENHFVPSDKGKKVGKW